MTSLRCQRVRRLKAMEFWTTEGPWNLVKMRIWLKDNGRPLFGLRHAFHLHGVSRRQFDCILGTRCPGWSLFFPDKFDTCSPSQEGGKTWSAWAESELGASNASFKDGGVAQSGTDWAFFVYLKALQAVCFLLPDSWTSGSSSSASHEDGLREVQV